MEYLFFLFVFLLLIFYANIHEVRFRIEYWINPSGKIFVIPFYIKDGKLAINDEKLSDMVKIDMPISVFEGIESNVINLPVEISTGWFSKNKARLVLNISCIVADYSSKGSIYYHYEDFYEDDDDKYPLWYLSQTVDRFYGRMLCSIKTNDEEISSLKEKDVFYINEKAGKIYLTVPVV